MHSRPLPNPADTSHPKRNGMSEHGGFIKWKTETKWKWSSTYICRTKRLPSKCHQEFCHPQQAIKDSSLAIQPPNVFNIIEGVQGAFTVINASWIFLFQIFKKASDTNAISNIEQNKYLSNISNIIQSKRNEPSLCDVPEPKKDPNIFLLPYQITGRKICCLSKSQKYVIRKQPQHDQAQINI